MYILYAQIYIMKLYYKILNVTPTDKNYTYEIKEDCMKKHKYFAIVLLCITLLLSTLSVNATENGENGLIVSNASFYREYMR